MQCSYTVVERSAAATAAATAAVAERKAEAHARPASSRPADLLGAGPTLELRGRGA